MSGARRLTIPSSGAIQNSGRVLMWMRPGSYSREKLSNVSRRRYQLEHTLLQLKVSNQKAPSVGLPSLSTFTEEMKAARFFVTMLVVVVQILLFVLAWDWFVDVARNAGREQRGGVGFGIFVYYGVFYWLCLRSWINRFSNHIIFIDSLVDDRSSCRGLESLCMASFELSD